MENASAASQRLKTPAPELPVADQNQWESWSTRFLLLAVVLAAATAVASPKFLGLPQGDARMLSQLLVGLAGLLLIIKMHLASQRKLLREVSAALLAAACRVDRLEQFSFIDPQTDLFNRRYLDRLFDQQAKWLNRSGRTVTMLLFELCTSGKRGGEHLIVQAALLLRANFRGSDYVLRNNEHEFLVLLPETTEEQAQFALNRLRDKIDHWNLENQNFEMAFRHELVTCTPGANLWESLQELEETLRRVPVPDPSLLVSVALSGQGSGLHETPQA